MKHSEHLTLTFDFEISAPAIHAFAALCLWAIVKWGVRLIVAITGASGVRRIYVSTSVTPTGRPSNATDGGPVAQSITASDLFKESA